MANYYSGAGGKYLRNHFPHHILSENFKIENVYIKKIDERDFWDNVSRAVADEVIEEGERLLSFEWKSISPTKTYLDFFNKGRGDETEVFKKYNAIGFLALAECIENKGRFLNSIIDGIFSICEESTWAVPAHFKICGEAKEILPDCDDNILDLFAVSRGIVLTFIYGTLLKRLDEVSPLIGKRIVYEIDKRILKPYMERDDHWWLAKNIDLTYWSINNWNTDMNSGIIYITLGLGKSRRVCYKLLNRAIDSLDEFIDHYPDDGACDEGPGYWNGSAGAMPNIIHMLDHILFEKSGIFENQKIYSMIKYIINMRIDGIQYASIADSHRFNQIGSFRLYSFWRLYNDKLMLNEAQALLKYQDTNKKILVDKRFSAIGAINALLYYDEVQKMHTVNAECDIRKSWMSGIQVMTTHQYADTSKGFFLCMKGGNNGESHNHNDIGSFMVFLNGKPVVLDPGIGTYTKDTFGVNRFKNWFANGFHHSIPIIGGIEQREGKMYKASDAQCSLTNLEDSLFMELKNAYSNKDKINSLVRTAVLCRTDSSVKITDKYDFSESMSYESILMLQSKPEITADGIIAGECSIKFTSNVPYTVTVEEISLEYDKVFSDSWGEKIYKAVIKQADVKNGTFSLIFKQQK